VQKTEPDMRLIHRAISAKNTLIRISKIIKESTVGNPDTRASETMSDIAQIIEESSNAIEIKEIVKEVYSNPEWFKSYDETSTTSETTIVNKCCHKKEKFIVTYDMGFGCEEKWLVCEEHEKKESFTKNILEKKKV
jgi:hypothetical protein